MTTTGYIAGGAPAETKPHLQRYLNAQATIYYHPAGGGVSDTGRITYLDNYWLELTKDNGDLLLIPNSAIRIIKILQPGKLSGDAGILLRAAEALPEEPRKQITQK
jgi:hypothetical protein